MPKISLVKILKEIKQKTFQLNYQIDSNSKLILIIKLIVFQYKHIKSDMKFFKFN
jgi:hypothetical protein